MMDLINEEIEDGALVYSSAKRKNIIGLAMISSETGLNQFHREPNKTTRIIAMLNPGSL